MEHQRASGEDRSTMMEEGQQDREKSTDGGGEVEDGMVVAEGPLRARKRLQCSRRRMGQNATVEGG